MKTDARLLTTASRLALAAGVSASLSVFATGVAAQQPAPEKQEETEALVTVPLEVQGQGEGSYTAEHLSSSKQTAPLLDTPQTVSVIPEQVFREQGARNLTEILKNTPGISFNAGENGFGTSSNNFMMRGFDASANIFYDGTRDSGNYTRDSFNVESVEVFKGPAADNGRGGAGGYVNIVTKTPGLRNFVNADVSYGFDEYDSEDRRRMTADVNQTIGTNSAIRLNTVIEDSGVAGREHAEAKAWGIAPSLAFGLGTDFRATFSLEHVERNDRPDWGVPGATIEGTFRYDPAVPAVRDAYFGLMSDFDDATATNLMARFEYDLSADTTLSNQTRWASVERKSRFTIPTGVVAGPAISTATNFYDRTNDTLTNLTDLSTSFATGGLKHNLSVGLELTREKSDANRLGAAVPAPGNADPVNPDPDRVGAAPFNVTATADVEIDTVALYAYDTVEFNPQWQVTGGVRAERYKAEVNSSDATIFGTPRYEESDTLLGGKVGLVFKPAENGSTYISFGISEQPPASNLLSNPDISRTGGNAFPGFVPGADPITMYNYEIGTKWELLGGRLMTSAAIFYTEKTNVPIVGVDPAVPGSPSLLRGYGEQIVQGIELGASGELTKEWNLYAGLLLMDSERKHSAYLDSVLLATTPGDYAFATTTNGDELAFTPNVTANLWTTYRFPIGLTVGGGMQYVGTSWLGRPDDALRVIPNGTFGKLPAHLLFNAMLSYEVNENIDVRLNIDNITDETYAQSTNWNGTRAALGAPRTFMVTTSFSF